MGEYHYKEPYNQVFKVCKTAIEKKKFAICELQYNNGCIKVIRPFTHFSKANHFSILIRTGYKTRVSISQESNRNILSWIKNRVFEYQMIKAINNQLSSNRAQYI